ncbi:MAG: hypothetical protein ACOYL6_05580 [Bacteriovoracaceae bacterium]
MKKFFRILLFLISSNSVWANQFQLEKLGTRFNLVITLQKLNYSSEYLKYETDVKKCNKELIKELNAEMLQSLPSLPTKDGIPFKVDQSELLVDIKSPLGNKLLSMDQRLLRFKVEERKSCH